MSDSQPMVVPAEHTGARLRLSSWPVLTLLLLVPLWCLGLFGRAAWTPDEPREYDIAVNMRQQLTNEGIQGSAAIPHLAGEPFLEKPPLTYWTAAASMQVFGVSTWAARLPNLLWAILTVLAAGMLAAVMVRGASARENNQGAEAALIAAVSCGTMTLIFQIQLWLATDAPLLAATALALLGAWNMAHARLRADRLLWSLVFWIGVVLAFFAKNLFGCLVPLGALALWILWDRRWSELGRWELYVAAVLPLVSAAVWIYAVAHGPDGPQQIRILLWDNNIGRVLPVETQEHYQLGHRNAPFELLRSLPWFLAPWTFACLAAIRWGVKEIRQDGACAGAVRFCAAAALPVLLLLCVSHTARGVYCGPVLLPFSVLLGLWFGMRNPEFDKFELFCLRATRVFFAFMAAVLATIAVCVGLYNFADLSVAHIVAGLLAAAILACGILRWREQSAPSAALAAFPLLVLALLGVQVVVFPLLDRSQDLGGLVQRAAPRLRQEHFAVLRDDETIRAALDYGAGLRVPNVRGVEDAADLLTRDPGQRFLLQTGAERTALHLPKFIARRIDAMDAKRDQRKSATAQAFATALQLLPLAEWSVPGGRRYVLLGRPPSPAVGP
jgi:4-amino-4-deoxy-L-arabinose transferase-like glycosyltransferase